MPCSIAAINGRISSLASSIFSSHVFVRPGIRARILTPFASRGLSAAGEEEEAVVSGATGRSGTEPDQASLFGCCPE